MEDHNQGTNLDVFPSDLGGCRILLCTESLGPVNGVSRTTKMLVDQLRANGVLVSVVAPYNHTRVNTFAPAPSPGEGFWYNSQELRLDGYPLPFNPELSIANPIRLSDLFEQTFDGPPDLIYLASPASVGFQVMVQLRQYVKELQVPIICNFQTDLAGYCSILFPWPLGDIANRIFGVVQGNLFRDDTVKTIFYPSNFVKRYLVNTAGVSERKLAVLTRGVDVEGFNPAKRSEELRNQWRRNDELVLFTCSRIAGEKGFGFLAQVATELDKRGMNFVLVIVGGNKNPAVEQDVKDMFASLTEKGKVIFVGFKLGEELMKHYASADVFLHCSITETFGLVVLEAMASGVPVIARDEGGPSDIVQNNKTGYLVPPDDLNGFVEKVLQLGREPDKRKELGAASRAAACETSWERVGNRVAWEMLHAIEQSEQDKATTPNMGRLTDQPPMTAIAKNDILRRFTEVKLVLVRSVIFVAWLFVFGYLVFAHVHKSVKTYVQRISSLAKTVD
ncbi:glycosyltransferase family 4 protein [Hypoxylon fragiforme]|uniref:glycosyltransferase family 4 protein n=1 Tax=Hypoxylon fragiforme TaxID=63214 RepID=UPI0020C63D16|nr:glycosyltransferase family 4 protein [Hypoxylon fragiforme]KAI2614800.1 glycosyltransferase family 4 protein [Hypoxylon fragiforme]